MWGNNFFNWGWPALGFLWVFPWVIILALVEIVLKGYALWFAARRGQKWWFIALLIINTLGILPLIYILIHRNKKK